MSPLNRRHAQPGRKSTAFLGAAGCLGPALGACALLLSLSSPLTSSRANAATLAPQRALLAYSHMPGVLANLAPLRETSASNQVSVDFALKPRNADQIQPLLESINDPKSANYGHYLTQAQYRSEFGPDQSQVDAVSAYAKSNGLTVTYISPSGLYVRAAGTAAQINAAFSVTLHDYVSPDPRDNGRIFHAPDQEPTVDASVAPLLTGVVGLSNAAHPRVTSLKLASRNARVQPLIGAHDAYGTGHSGALSPTDVANLYSFKNSLASSAGQNQVLGLVEYDTFYASDVTKWENYYSSSLTSSFPTITPVSVDGVNTSGTPSGDQDEVTLDIDQLLALAYKAKQIRVYEASQNDVTEEQVYDAMANDSTPPSVISCSWGDPEPDYSESDVQSEANVLQQLALQGQTVCASSGDSGAYDTGDTSDGLSVDDPASQPTVVGVGGTNLSDTENSTQTVVTFGSESSWSDPAMTINKVTYPADGGGGGISEYWSLPSFQSGAFNTSVNPQGSTTMRNVPDVSMFADPYAGGYDVYVTDPQSKEPAGWYGFAGTSAAAPLWAAIIADANVERLAAGKAVLGEALSQIYTLAESSQYATDFYDVKDGSNNRYYDAVTGYDNSTGWGTPYNGSQLITDLAASGSTTTTSPAATTRFDFNKDGHADLIWYNTGSGAVSVWDMNDQSVLQYGATFTSLAPSSGWQPVAAPDVNGDGSPDLIWWNSQTGALSAWTLNNTTVTSYGSAFATLSDTTWKPVAAGDVTGTTWELVFENSVSGDISVWQMNGTTVTSYGGTLGSVGGGTGWQCVGAPDLNGDGHSDLLFWNSQTGNVAWWGCNLSTPAVLSYNGNFAQVSDTSWHLMGSEDTNGDGHPDLIWWNATTGVESRWLLNGTTVTQYGGTSTQVTDTTWQPTAIR